MNSVEFKKYLKGYTTPQLKDFYNAAKMVNNFLPQKIADEWRIRGLIHLLYRTILEKQKKKGVTDGK